MEKNSLTSVLRENVGAGRNEIGADVLFHKKKREVEGCARKEA